MTCFVLSGMFSISSINQSISLCAGASVNAQTFTKGTALTYACENGHTEVAEVLIHHGAELVSCHSSILGFISTSSFNGT